MRPTKLKELEEKLQKYQEEYDKLLKSDKAASSRYGNEFRDLQMRVLENLMAEAKLEIVELKEDKGKNE